MTDLWSYLTNTKKPIVLYGTGNGADKVMAELTARNVKISGIFSSAGFKKNKAFYGHIVTDYNSLKASLGEMIILVCFGSHLPNVINTIKDLAKENELYAVDVPIKGDTIFNINFVQENLNKLKAAYDLLSDEKSRQVFEGIVRFKLSGKPQYLYSAETDRDEALALLDIKSNEQFLDLGAFTGDTVLEFVSKAKSYQKIVAVEPDARNYKRLIEGTNEMPNTKCINAAISDSIGFLTISANHGRGNGDNGKKIKVPSITIDSLRGDISPTIIKFDVEGEELAAIKGGVDTITSLKPKLHLACYHTPFDIFEIPLLIKQMVPEYKIYMRHHPCIPAWDVNYIFI